MIRRLWWYGLGLLSGAWATLWVTERVRRARQAVTLEHLGKESALTLADILEAGGRRLR